MTVQELMEYMQRLIAAGHIRPGDRVCIQTDFHADRLAILKDDGWREQVQLVGFGANDFREYPTPTLCSISIPEARP